MLERFTGDARGVVTGAREGALRLGHDWIGCEHLLLALTATGGEVGIDPAGPGDHPRAGQLGGGPAGRGRPRGQPVRRPRPGRAGLHRHRSRRGPGQGRGGVRPGRLHRGAGPAAARRHWVRRRVRRARQARWAAAPAGGGTHAAGLPGAPASGKGSGAGPWRVPFTPRARKCLTHAVHEARAEHTGQIGVEHLGLAIVSMTDGAVPPILSALGSSGPRLRAEILRRYRQAS